MRDFRDVPPISGRQRAAQAPTEEAAPQAKLTAVRTQWMLRKSPTPPQTDALIITID